MATDDCHVMAEKPCPCGEGTVIVESCIPDHPWAKDSQRFLKSALNCRKCSEVYALENRASMSCLGPVVVVSRSEVETREQLLANWHKARKELAGSPKGQALVQKFVHLLQSQPSVAAMHRLLSDNGFHVRSIAGFRQEVKGPEGIAGLVKRQFGASEFPNMMAALGKSDAELEEAVQKAKGLWDAAQEELPIVGQPVIEAFKR